MKNYFIKNEFIKSYEIIDDKIVVYLNNKNKYSISYSKEKEEELIKKINVQRESILNIKKNYEKIKYRAKISIPILICVFVISGSLIFAFPYLFINYLICFISFSLYISESFVSTKIGVILTDINKQSSFLNDEKRMHKGKKKKISNKKSESLVNINKIDNIILNEEKENEYYIEEKYIKDEINGKAYTMKKK